MAIALVLAAFAGAGMGLVWQSSGFAEDEGQDQEGGEDQDAPEGGGAEAAAEDGEESDGSGRGEDG